MLGHVAKLLGRSQRVEDAVASIEGIDRIQSYSSESVSNVAILFDLDVDPVVSATTVRERLAAIRSELPQQAEDPTISRMDVGAASIRVLGGRERELRPGAPAAAYILASQETYHVNFSCRPQPERRSAARGRPGTVRGEFARHPRTGSARTSLAC